MMLKKIKKYFKIFKPFNDIIKISKKNKIKLKSNEKWQINAKIVANK